jgi:hypothetical protein
MKLMNAAVASFFALLLVGCATPSHLTETATRLKTEFVGNTPCDKLARDFLKIPGTSDCERVQWRLILQEDDTSGARGTYTLTTIHGMSETNGLGFFQGTPSIT